MSRRARERAEQNAAKAREAKRRREAARKPQNTKGETMDDVQWFRLDVVVTATTGKMWCRDFGEVHRLIEHSLGHPVWTHELGQALVWQAVRDHLLAQNPNLADVGEPESVEALDAWMDGLRRRFGDEVAVRRGTAERTESPLESMGRIMGDKPVIVVEVP
jgi:hypothetical protein